MIRIKKLDKYIIGKFMGAFFLALALLTVLVVIFDLSEKIDDFVEKQAPVRAVIVDYYLNFVPFFMNQYSPMVVFLTVILFTSRMAQNTEIIAILSCGTSFHRMMVPYMVSAAIIALLSLGLGLWVIPKANVTRVAFEQKYNPRAKVKFGRDMHYKLEDNKYVYFESFSSWNNTAYNFTLEQVKDQHLVSKLSAESAQWDSLSGSWKLRDWFIRDYGEGLQDRIRSGKQLDTTLSLTIDDFYFNEYTIERLDKGQLDQLIDTQRSRGDATVMNAEMEMHRRYSMPLSAFILTIIGVALCSKKRRGGMGWNIAVGLALGFSYVLFMQFSKMFVVTGTLPVGLAIWIPNILYAIIAAVLYILAPK